MGYYEKEYAEYYRGIRGYDLSSGRNSGYANLYSRNHTKTIRKKWTHGIVQIFAIQTIGIILLGGIVYSFKFSERVEINNVFNSIKAVLREDYYFKDNSIDFNLKEIIEKISKK